LKASKTLKSRQYAGTAETDSPMPAKSSLETGEVVTLAVLAGGEGTRMGFPKQNLKIADRPILEYLLDQWKWGGPTLVVTTPGREHPPGADRFTAEAVDSATNQGPLRGVLTALENATTAFVVVATVDMPGVAASNLKWLGDRLLARPDLHGLMLQREIDGRNQIEPFPFACRRGAAPVIAAQMAEGQRSVHSLAKISRFAVESAPLDWSPATWTNLNFPEEFHAFMQSLGF
jgi:molybdopterin-guanine dinucleotide biosynthesis protein A